MGARSRTKNYCAVRRRGGDRKDLSLEFIGEEPVLIRVNDRPYSVVMRTPGEEVAHAAGFSLGEGIASTPADIKTIGYDEDLEPNVVDVWLHDERSEMIHERLERRFFVSQTSCGICGKELIKDLQQNLTPATSDFRLDMNRVLYCFNKLCEEQQYYQTTRGSHAALLFDGQQEVISFAEDVGRHNALDKAIGKAFLGGTLPGARIVVLSSRISYELVQKTARAHIPMMISGSRPTSLAVEMGTALNMTMAFPENDAELVIVCGEERIR